MWHLTTMIAADSDPDKLAATCARRDRGERPARIAEALGISRASVYRHLESDSQQD